MSEIQDAAQIIKVSFEGAEIILKMGNTGWQFVKDICAVFKKVLDQEKLSGKTSVQKLLKMGGDLQVFRFETKDLERVKALANKYGILYSILPDLNEKDGMSEILFHSQAAPRIQSMMAKIEHSNIGTLDEYYENAEPDKVEQLVEEVKKPALPESKECELVARELAKNQVEKISDVRSRLNMTWLQIWPIICYMEEQGILEKGKEGTVTLTRTPEQVEELVDSQQWKQLFGEEEAKRRSTGSSQETEEKMQVIRRIQKEKRNNPGVNAITIDQKLVYEETEHHIKTRIPYRKNEFIWLDKSEISWINDHKTIFAGLEKKKEYAILDLEDRFLRKTSGEDLYRESYDPVHRERARQEQEKIRRRQEGTTEPGSREKNHTGAKEVENRSNSEKEETVLGHVSYWWHSFRLWRLSLERVLSARKGYQLFFKPSGSGDGSPVCQLLERNFLKSNHFGDFCICDWYGHVCHQPEKLYAGTGIWYRCFCRSEKSGKAVCG